MENQNQTNPQTNSQSNTAVMDAPKDVMTLGDFMSQNAITENGETQPKEVMTVNDFMNGTETVHHDVEPLPPEHKPGFLKGMAMNLYAGLEEGSANVLEFLGGINRPAIEKSRQIAVDIYKQTASDNFGIQQANEFARSMGNLGTTLPIDIMTGGASKAALAGKVLPAVESALASLPDFALGSGFRGLIESLQRSVKANESPVTAVPKAVASGAANVALNASFAASGVGFKGITTMAAIGGAMATADALSKGNYPTKEELAAGMAQGAAYGVVFTILPHLARGTGIEQERTALKDYEEKLDSHAQQGDFQSVKNTTEALLQDSNIRPEIRGQLEMVLQEVQTPSETPQKQAETPQEGTKTSKSALSASVVKDAIKAGLKEQFPKESMPEHEVRNMDDVASRASEFISKNYELAKKIALGQAPEQDDLRAQELFTAIRIKAQAEGDVDTLLELASSDKAAAMATELGQRIKALDATSPEDVVKALREIKNSRVPKKSEKLKVVKEIHKYVKKAEPKLKDWNDFVKSIQC